MIRSRPAQVPIHARWDFDNGQGGSVLGLHPTPDGDELVWTGQVFVDGDQGMRIDRVVGPAWQGNATNDDDQGADVCPLPDGGYIAASAAGDAFDLETRLRLYSASGTETNSGLFDGSDNGESNWPLGIEIDDAGDYYVLGAFVGPESFESYLLKSNSNFTQDWKRSLTTSPETDGAPFVYDFDVRGDGRIALAGADNSRIWIAVLDSDGQVEDQITLVSEFDQSIAYDITWTPSGDIVVAGATNDGGGWARFVRMYDELLLDLKEALGASAARELDPERSRRTAQGRLSDGLRGGQQPNLERSPSERLYPTCARQSRQPWHVGALRRAALAAA